MSTDPNAPHLERFDALMREAAASGRWAQLLMVAYQGGIAAIDEQGSGLQRLMVRPVVLRQVLPQSDALYGDRAGWIRSEALMKLDFGKGRLPGMLVLGAEDPHQFKQTHGTDLLAFFAGVFERTMRRWLS